MTSTREASPRHRRRLVAGFVVVGMGLLFLAIGLNRPTIANMRTVDLVLLLAIGGMLAAGLVAVAQHFVLRREG